ncbi:hypothetical protein BH24ACT21_BH24ACT21_13060 [soil metagenome]
MFGVLADRVLVRGYVSAVDLVVRNLALDPLYLRTRVVLYVAGSLRDPLQLFVGEITGSRYLPLVLAWPHDLLVLVIVLFLELGLMGVGVGVQGAVLGHLVVSS